MDENKKTNQRKNPKDADTEDSAADIESKIDAEESEDESLIASFSKKFSLGKKALQEKAESLNNDFQQAVEQTDETIKRINKHSTLLSMITRPADWKSTYSEYKTRRNKEKEDLNVYGILFDGASPSIEYYMLTVLSCIIATTGLIQGSTAVIIGAMIVAPLMTPILASSLGVIWGDFKLMRMSFFSLVKGALLAILISSALAYIIPLSSYSNEILARTTPSLFDILVALASGSVGAYGYANKKINNTLVGIAIAVALMPPLCTIGIGIGTLNSQIAIGATVLFLINYVSISLAGAIIFMAMKIHPIAEKEGVVMRRATSQIILSLVALSIIAVPIGSFMINGYRLTSIKNELRDFVKTQPGELGVASINSEISQLQYTKLRYTYKVEVMITAASEPDYEAFEKLIDKIYKTDIIDNINISFVPAIKLH